MNLVLLEKWFTCVIIVNLLCGAWCFENYWGMNCESIMTAYAFHACLGALWTMIRMRRCHLGEESRPAVKLHRDQNLRHLSMALRNTQFQRLPKNRSQNKGCLGKVPRRTRWGKPSSRWRISFSGWSNRGPPGWRRGTGTVLEVLASHILWWGGPRPTGWTVGGGQNGGHFPDPPVLGAAKGEVRYL
jgi:hypothetical protein